MRCQALLRHFYPLVIVLSCLAGCESTAPVTVTYRLSGTAHTARATYHTAAGDVAGDLDLPWEATVQLPRGAEARLSAQNALMSGTVVCELIINGHSQRHEAATYNDAVDCRQAIE